MRRSEENAIKANNSTLTQESPVQAKNEQNGAKFLSYRDIKSGFIRPDEYLLNLQTSRDRLEKYEGAGLSNCENAVQLRKRIGNIHYDKYKEKYTTMYQKQHEIQNTGKDCKKKSSQYPMS